MENLKFVWNGWRDPYDSCTTPTLINEKNEIVWQGGFYYSGEIKENINQVRDDIKRTAARYNLDNLDLSSNNHADWGMEDRRTWSNTG